MSSPDANQDVHFRAADEPDVVAYRPLSRAALVAAVLGVLSFAAILHPLLLIVPLVALVAGLMALRSIAVNTSGLTGRRLAVMGMLLATLFASGAVGRLMSRDWMVTARGRQFAQDWIQAVIEGRREVAYEMSLPPPQRQTRGIDLVEYYGGDPEKNDALQRYFADSPARELAEFGSVGTLSYEGVFDAGWSASYGDLIALEYLLEYRDEDQAKSTRFHVVVQRKMHRQHGRGQWFVHQLGIPEEKERQLEAIRNLHSS